jgi:hypothetical protein
MNDLLIIKINRQCNFLVNTSKIKLLKVHWKRYSLTELHRPGKFVEGGLFPPPFKWSINYQNKELKIKKVRRQVIVALIS